MYECSLPMYDMPEVQKYNEIILKYLAKEIRHIIRKQNSIGKIQVQSLGERGTGAEGNFW